MLALAVGMLVYKYHFGHFPSGGWLFPIEGWFFFVVAIVVVAALVRATIAFLTTEIAITSRRIIYKTGLIMRRTLEMNVDKVESVDVKQSILGRLLDYGTVLVRGVGTGLEPLKTIAAPLEFRHTVLSHTVFPSVSTTVPPSPPRPRRLFPAGNRPIRRCMNVPRSLNAQSNKPQPPA